ncbi:hypothetical protein EJ05DRAFT_499635 [Pseudovirgaria hyperparasitica]|uniref:Eisosome protein 1 n=1 Tax=Pseudovirgaria hyperparasitica TaxID=470096 RepID=A0A6A6W9H9_9PEZI|nr:uncharacterized protein EJ05DRAFT_499635 [Pseudovirgaria hyperparasitica]KAF2759215.1 hypothetical protein EJ05DRAFT_499635 [Pseudovirgaria hyperparasitica]
MTSDGALPVARPLSHASLQSNTTTSHSITCPDPSAHAALERQARLQETASVAALLVTRDRKESNPNPDVKLSSASAAASLKYAKPQDLPAFPVVGVVDASASASKAALLANANPTEVNWWKPEQSEAASKAALLAHDHKMAPMWQPEASAAGSKAALLAHRDGPKLDLWQPYASPAGNSAAGAALRKCTSSPAPPPADSVADDRRRKALMAARGAYSGSQRRRSGSTPTLPTYPDSANSAHNALSAATIVHRNSTRLANSPLATTQGPSKGALNAARVQNIGKNVDREMFGSAPPFVLEAEEKKRTDALRASAISMAQGMYTLAEDRRHKQEALDSQRSTGLAAATSVHGRSQSTSSQDIRQQALQYIHIQDAAQKLAAERLSKIKVDDSAAYRDYYGYGKPAPRSRLSVRRPNRRRASSEGAANDDSSDEEQSRRIRNQMSIFNNQVQQVDSRKRQKDREAVLAAAEKKVHAQMHSMDERVFNATGKMSQSMIDEWDAKARAKATAESQSRMENHGKVDIGGGRFMDQSEIDAIASSRMQPTLDDINDQAERRRARDEEIRLDIEQKRRELNREKEREAELKAEEKRLKDEDKRRSKLQKQEEKEFAKAEKEAEKARKAEEKRLSKHEKQQSKEASKPTIATTTTPEPTEARASSISTADPPFVDASSTAARDSIATDPTTLASVEPRPEDPTSPTSPTKSDGGLRRLITKLKRRSKHTPSASNDAVPTSPAKASSFVGGAALTGAKSPDDTATADKDKNRAIDEPARGRSPSISSLSSSDQGESSVSVKKPVRELSDDESDEDRDKVDSSLVPPPKFKEDNIGTGAIRKSGSPVRGTIFKEEF